MKKTLYAGILVLMLLPLVSISGADPILFGPQAFDRTEGPPNVYDENFPSTFGSGFLVVFNGDDEQDSRVTSGSIVLNGNEVISSDELNQDTERIIEGVNLNADNTMQITLDGEPGGYMIVMVVRDKKILPEFTAGRIQLAWTSIADPAGSVQLRLKNGSPRFARHFKVRFYNEDGSLASVSQTYVLADHGSLNSPLQSFLPNGSAWQSGSVEILFAGRGGGRILGFGIQTNTSTLSETSLPLQWGGIRHHFHLDKKKK